MWWQFYEDTNKADAATSATGKTLMDRLIDKLAMTAPDELKELRSLRTTFQRRLADILAYFDHAGKAERAHGSDQRQTRPFAG